MDNFKRASELKVGDQFKHVNRNDDTVYVVRRLSNHLMIFTSVGGHVELGVEFDTVVNLNIHPPLHNFQFVKG